MRAELLCRLIGHRWPKTWGCRDLDGWGFDVVYVRRCKRCRLPQWTRKRPDRVRP